MVTIICGSRSFASHPDPLTLIATAITLSTFPVTYIRSGGAKGIDTHAIRYAKANGITVDVVAANWAEFGKGAGHERNVRMCTKRIPEAEALICIWDSVSTGSIDCYSIMRDLGRKVYLYIP